MSAEIGSVRATFTASAAGLVGAVNESVSSLNGLKATQANAASGMAASASAMREAAKITREMRTPAEQYAASIAKLDDYLARGLLTQEVYGRAVAKAKSDMDSATGVADGYASAAAKAERVVNGLTTAIKGIGEALSSISQAGSAVVELGIDIAKVTAAWKVFSTVTSAFRTPEGILGIVVGLSKTLAVIRVAEAGFGALGIEVSGTADFASKAALAFAAFKVAVASGITTTNVSGIAAQLNTTLGITRTLTTVLGRVGVSAATTSAALSSLGTVGAAAGGVLTRVAAMSIPGFGQLAGAVYLGTKAVLASRDAAYEMAKSVASLTEEGRKLGVTFQDMQIAKAIDAGTAREDILRLGVAINAIDARHFDDLAFAVEGSSQAGERSQSAIAALGTTLSSTFTGLFAGTTEGFASLTNGFADIVGGLNSIATPIAQVLRPFATLVGGMVQGVLQLAGAIGQVVGVALRFAGTLAQIVASPVIVGFNNFADTLRSGIGAGFEWLTGKVASLHKMLDGLSNALSRIPVIGQAFASNQGGNAPGNPAAGAQAAAATVADTKAAMEEEAAAVKAVSDAIAQQEKLLSSAIDMASGLGSEGFDAAVQYQTALRELNTQLEAGILNETSYARAAAEAKAAFDDHVAAIKEEEAAARAAADAIVQQEKSLSAAIDAAAGLGEAGFQAAAEYQVELRRLNAELQAGILNQTGYAQAAADAKQEFDAQVAAIKERNKAVEAINGQIAKSASAGKELGAAADGIRQQFRSVAESIRKDLESGLLSPEDARRQMAEATDAMNEELKRLGDDMNFAEKIRDQMKTAGQKVREEINAIEANATLTRAEKDRAKDLVREKARESLPGGQADDPVAKFRKAQKDLQDAFANGVIGQQELTERQIRVRNELNESVADFRDKQEQNANPDRRATMASEVNTSEGMSTFFRILRGQDDPTAKQVAEMRRQTRLLERVHDALTEQEVVQI